MKLKDFKNLKPGDQVRVRTYEEMLTLKGVQKEKDGTITVYDKKTTWDTYLRSMADFYGGKVVKVETITSFGDVVKVRTLDGEYRNYNFTRKMLRNVYTWEETK